MIDVTERSADEPQRRQRRHAIDDAELPLLNHEAMKLMYPSSYDMKCDDSCIMLYEITSNDDQGLLRSLVRALHAITP